MIGSRKETKMPTHYYRFGNPTFCKFVSKALTEQGVSVVGSTEQMLVVEGDLLADAHLDMVRKHGGKFAATYATEGRDWNIEPTMEQAPPSAPKKKVPPMKAAKNLKKPEPQKPKPSPKQQADAEKMKVIQDAAMKTLKARVESEPKKFPKLAAALGIKTEEVREEGESIQEVSPPSGSARRFSKDPEVKRKFKAQYGKDWQSKMYATAWDMYNKGS